MRIFLQVCLIFLQLFFLQTTSRDLLNLSQLPASDKKAPRKGGRGPASTIPRDDIRSALAEERIWLSNVWVEDKVGVMNRMKGEFAHWERVENYRNFWGIESTGLYDTPAQREKVGWFKKMLLRYVDKRFSHEMKDARRGSTLQKMRVMKSALRPSSTAELSRNIRLRFRAKLLRMKVYMKIENPWVESETEVSIRGNIISRFRRDFKDFGIKTSLEYRFREGDYTASFSKKISPHVTAIFSTTQPLVEPLFWGSTNSAFQLRYYTSF